MNPDEISDDKIFDLVNQTDLELFNSGVEIKDRELKVPFYVLKKLGYDYIKPILLVNHDNFSLKKRIFDAFSSIYRKNDLVIGGHVGVFAYRDAFARFSVPRVMDKVVIRPFDYVDLNENQLKIMSSEPDSVACYLDAFSDVSDIQYGIREIKKPFADSELVLRFINSARFQLHGAAAILTGGYDYRGSVQCSSVAIEFALKAGAAANGLTEGQMSRKPYGHDMSALANFVRSHWPNFNDARIMRTIAKQPDYVQGRYSAAQPNRRVIGEIAMGAQYIVAEIVRQMCDRDFRKEANIQSPRDFTL